MVPVIPTPNDSGPSVRTLFLIDGLGTGGAERSLAELVVRLPEYGIDPVVGRFIERPNGVEDDVRSAGIDVRTIRATSWPGRVREVRALITDLKPDLLHTTHFRPDVVGRAASTGTGIRVMSSLAIPPYPDERQRDRRVHPLKLRCARAVDAFSARRHCDHFHAVSGAVKAQAVRALRLDPDRITVIHRGRDRRRLGDPTPQRRTAARSALRVDPDEPVILTIGRHEFQKAHSTAIAALVAVRERHPDARLLIAGREGATSRELHAQLVQLDLVDAVELLGHRPDVGDLLCAADVYVCPSLYEGSPGAVIEAMAMARPIVAADFAGAGEVISDGADGLVVSRHMPTEFAAAISELLDNPERGTALGQAARQRFLAHHTLEAITPRMVDLLRRVAMSPAKA